MNDEHERPQECFRCLSLNVFHSYKEVLRCFLWEDVEAQGWKDPSLRSIPESRAPRRPLALAQGGVAPPPTRLPPRETGRRDLTSDLSKGTK